MNYCLRIALPELQSGVGGLDAVLQEQNKAGARLVSTLSTHSFVYLFFEQRPTVWPEPFTDFK